MNTDGDIARALAVLDVDPDSYRVLGLLPLVYVAWADGRIQRGESDRIRRIAAGTGWLAGRGSEILAGWLAERPAPEAFAHGLRTLRAVAGRTTGLGIAVSDGTLRASIRLAREVAAVAGGFWGLDDPIAPEEDAALDALVRALGIPAASWRQVAAPDGDIAPGPPGHPLLGSVPDLLRDPLQTVEEALDAFGDVVRIRLGDEVAHLVYRPEHLQRLLRDGAQVMPQRAVAPPATPPRVEDLAATARRVVASWPSGPEVPADIADLGGDLTARLLAWTVTGRDPAEGPPALRAGLRTIRRHGAPPSVPLPRSVTSESPSLGPAAMAVSTWLGAGATEALQALVSGLPSTAAAVGWAGHLLSGHPAWAERVRAEPAAARAVLAETLRLYPPRWILCRRLREAVCLGGYRVPAGTLALGVVYRTQRLHGIWEAPSRFDPERFRTAVPPGAYLPFGAGDGACPSDAAALQVAETVLRAIVERFDLRAFPGFEVIADATTVLRPTNGVLVTLTRR